ncbi:MAG TPA: hypothetical protein VN625_00695 [Desulfuromonadaceae bacterium]|nr:hypothetical protein [Desulfuromonadaceae bacterium]
MKSKILIWVVVISAVAGIICAILFPAVKEMRRSKPEPIIVGRIGEDPAKAYSDGRAEAEKDVKSGKLIVKTFGLPAPWREIYRTNLMKRYKIQLQTVAGCVVTEAEMKKVYGYNQVSGAEIGRRYGTNLLNKVANEAEKEWGQAQKK